MCMRRVAFHNLGCKVNAYETEAMLQQLEQKGYEIVSFEETADIYVINTCTVTSIADRKSRQMLHRARKKNPDALVVAVGCYVQADKARAEADTAVDLVIGNDQKSRLAELIETHANATLDINATRSYESLHISRSTGHTRAFLKIQDGCNQFCSYCLIPYVRGRVRSRQPEDIYEEAARLAENGCREIVLTGIHLSSYGCDFDGAPMGEHLKDLILRMAEIPQLSRIRLGSLEPRVITREFAEALRDCGKICPHFHLSLQSGCDATLKRMNRKYTSAEYAEKCRLLREVFEHPAITTDVIVGFPGETEEEFEQTRAYLEELALYEMHIFKYSVREGTRAASMPDQVPEPEKTRRSAILLEMSRRHSEEFRAWYEGKNVELLLEEEITQDGEPVYVGHTREYIRGTVPAGDHHAGEVVVIKAEGLTAAMDL